MFALKSLKSLQQIFFRNNRSVHISLWELSSSKHDYIRWTRMLRFNSSEDCSILWHSASSLRTIIASSVLNRNWVQSVNCHAVVKMVIGGQVRWINEKLIFWLLGNLSLKFTIFLLQQTDRGLTKKIIRKHSKMASYHHQPDCSFIVYCQRLKPGDLLSQGEAAAHLHVHVPPFIRPD